MPCRQSYVPTRRCQCRPSGSGNPRVRKFQEVVHQSRLCLVHIATVVLELHNNSTVTPVPLSHTVSENKHMLVLVQNSRLRLHALSEFH